MAEKEQKTVHFIGIGGVGMSAAASISLERGFSVSGCDLQRNKYTEQLEQKGCTVYYSHSPDHVENADIVVYSSAIPPEIEELKEAFTKDIPVYKRAIYTLKLMEEKKLVGVSGSHGKTTTTWMTGHAFLSTGLEPSLMVGGTVPELYGNFRIGTGEWFISEVDESDGTIREINPFISVITNIDSEHMDFYKTKGSLSDAFCSFCSNTAREGSVILCGEDEGCRKLGEQLDREYCTYGFSNTCDVYASDISEQDLYSEFTIIYKETTYSNVRLQFCGEHNILNSLAAFSAAVSGGIDPAKVVKSIELCRPVGRRFELSGNRDEVVLINDYAHHPTEIKAVLKAVETHFNSFRKIAVFQPHRYTRLRDCWEKFLHSFSSTNILIVLPVYSANEEPIHSVNAKRFTESCRESGIQAEYIKKDLVCRHLDTIVRKGDCVMFLGAGDIGDVYSEFARSITV